MKDEKSNVKSNETNSGRLKKNKLIMGLISAVLILCTHVAFAEIPYTFENDSVADANMVMENFNYLDDKIDDLQETKVAKVFDGYFISILCKTNLSFDEYWVFTSQPTKQSLVYRQRIITRLLVNGKSLGLSCVDSITNPNLLLC